MELKEVLRSWISGVVVLAALLPVSPSYSKELAGKTEQGDQAVGVRYAEGRLSVHVIDRPLDDILDEIARQGGFHIRRGLRSEESITIRFEQLSLELGLRRLLRDRSYALRYPSRTKSSSQSMRFGPLDLMIFPFVAQFSHDAPVLAELAAPDPIPNGSKREADITRLRTALNSEAASAREIAVIELAELDHPEVVDLLQSVINDRDVLVREAVVMSLAVIGGDDAASALTSVLHDDDTAVREMAVNALSDIGGDYAVAMLQAAQDNADAVRESALQAPKPVSRR